MKPFATLTFIGLVLAGGYVMYRVQQAQSTPEIIPITATTNFADYPPTFCEVTNRSGAIDGELYIFNKFARFDLRANGKPGSGLFVIVNQENTAFMWNEGATEGRKGEYRGMYDLLNMEVLLTIECKPWWIPHGSTFIPPDGITFK